MKWIWKLRAAVLLLALACGLSANAASGDFVRAQGAQLVRGAQDTPYYYIGAHFWYAPLLGCSGAMGDRDRLRTELDSLQALGVQHVRVLAGVKWRELKEGAQLQAYDWDTDEADSKLLRGLDCLMAEAGKRSMTVTVCLTPTWKNDATWRERYAEYVRRVVSRTNSLTKVPYSDDASLLAWQLCDEAFVETAAMDEAFVSWVRETAALIKGIDGNHLVSVGLDGAESCHGDVELYQRVMGDEHIDFLTVRLKPIAWKWTSSDRLFDALPNVFVRANDFLDFYDRLARKLNKPYVIDAFAYPRDGLFTRPGTMTYARDAYFNYVFSKLNESRQAESSLAGVNWLGWAGSGRKADEDGKLRPENYLAEYPQQQQGVYSVYDADSTTLQMVRRAALP